MGGPLLATAAETLPTEERLGAILEHLPIGVGLMDKDGRWIVRNAALRRFVPEAIPSADPRSVPRWRAWDGNDRPLPEMQWPSARALRGETVLPGVEMLFSGDDGLELWTRVSAAPLRDASGEILGAIGVVENIDAEKRAQIALRESEERFQMVSRATKDAIWDWDLSTNALEWSGAVSTLFGYDPEVVGADVSWWCDRVHDEDRDRVLSGIHAVIDGTATEWRDEYRFVRADGTFSYVFDRGYVIRDRAGKGVRMVGAMQDVTERRRAEESLRKSEQLNATIASNATLGLLMMDAQQHCTFMNPAAEKITGFTFSELRGKQLHDSIHHSHPDGTPYAMEECPIDRALPTRSQESGEDVFVHKDGHFYPVAFTASPILEGGKPVGTVIEVRDTTVEKASERRLREAIAARDEFLSVASHELRTPLTALSLQLERLQKMILRGPGEADPEKALKTIAVAVRQADRLETLVEGLLNVSRLTSGQLQLHLEPLDLRDLVRETVERLASLASRAHCEIVLELGDAAVGTWDRERIDSVLMNLLGNAIKYGAGEPIHVTVEGRETDVILAVKDRGIGISTDDVARIFDRFERAVSPSNYGGLGLGLYISRQIVEAHGGEITVESAPGQGATFFVRLPRASEARA